MPVSGNLYYAYNRDLGLEKPPIILIHGAGGSHLYWPPEIRRLNGYRVYAIDLPGHGKSELHGGQQTISNYSKSVVQWLESVEFRRAVMVGHSMGGAIALETAIHYPDQVLGLILIGSGARLRVNPDLLHLAADMTTYHKVVKLLTAFSFSEATPQHLVDLSCKRLLVTRPSVLLGDLQACDHFDVIKHLAGIGQPTLVLCGSEDKMTPPRYAQFLASSIAQAKLEVLPNAGHMLMLEQPGLVADKMIKFLDRIPFIPGEWY